MDTIRVNLAERSYPIYIGAGLLANPALLNQHLNQPRVAVVTNDTVAELYLAPLRQQLAAANIKVTEIVLPDGEAFKTWESLNQIYDAMLSARCDRGTTILALGGGVVGDLAGFAAATFMRGIPFIQIPTTLLAQVDSSVGGKTAINHPLGKNMVGAFYQPVAVFADMNTLTTLPDRELRAGLAEVIKHGLIEDAVFLAWLEENIGALLAKDAAALGHAVRRSVEVKAGIVARDERETGDRALLNFGHTFGHAIEAGLGFGKWLHGEAIGAGLVMASDLSARLGHLPPTDVSRVRQLVSDAGLPVAGPMLGSERYLELMSLDKKSSGGRLRFILLQSLGKAYIADGVPVEQLRATLAAAVA